MKKLFLLLTISIFLSSCNDGDVIVTTFDFDDESLNNCGEAGGYVLFKINTTTNESISLSLDTNNNIFDATEEQMFELNGEGNIVNYRKYSGALSSDYFCNNVPPTSPSVTSEFIAASGDAILNPTITLDDEDGLEESSESDLDSDGDGLLDYYDNDDDGDNVLTSTELGANFLNGITNEPQDSDKDGIYDYLDTDDDNDTILTRNEDLDGNLEPSNDTTDGIPNYLNSAVTTENIVNEYRPHTYNYNSDISVLLSDIVLIGGDNEVIQQTLSLGTIEGAINETISITPSFE
ncbi:MAG: hypothetical protein ACJAVA_000419 [Flavobacteriaceae bacterium]|jgi:hypothetical protein